LTPPPTGTLGVLYVAGIPRSGSTVLGHALGGLPGTIFVGELALFWRRFSESELCSCGEPLPECHFWSAVVGKAFGPITRQQAKELNRLERRVVRRQWWLALIPVSRSTRWSGGANAMLDERNRLNRSILELADATWIVDSGKGVVFGAIASRLQDTEFSTVHLVRDPRGVAFSWLKHVKSDSEPRDMPRSSALMTSVRWIVSNGLINILLSSLSDTYHRLRYEDLVSHPDGAVRRIASASMGVPEPDHSSATLRFASEHHVVGSNPGVRRNLGRALRLKLDEEWRTELPPRQRWLVNAVCCSLMVGYKYSLRR
jgi:hypothetical protein